MEKRNLRKERIGEVVSNKMNKTIVIAVKTKMVVRRDYVFEE